jgi:hypothetical protein
LGFQNQCLGLSRASRTMSPAHWVVILWWRGCKYGAEGGEGISKTLSPFSHEHVEIKQVDVK